MNEEVKASAVAAGVPLPVQCVLDQAERMNRRFRILIWVLVAALLGAAGYYGMAGAATPMPELLARGLLVLAILIVLVALRLRWSIDQNAQLILRAIYAQRRTEPGGRL